MTRVVIHQPDFVPYLGFFERLLVADVYVVMDDVQFIRRGWQHRDKIKTRAGHEAWLTLSVKKGDYHQRIQDVELADDRDEWAGGNLNLLREHYRAAPHFARFFPEVEALYGNGRTLMADFNLAFLAWLFDRMDIRVPVVRASTLGTSGQKNEKLINLVKAVGGDTYVTGTGSLDYLDPALFAAAGIGLEVRRYAHPVYPQINGPFLPYLSVLDALFNVGDELAALVRRTVTP